MPADINQLIQCLARMKQTYLENPSAVRSQAFINHLHEYVVDELRRHGVDERRFQIVREARLYGSHKHKDVDVAVIHPLNGPQIIIGVRSQMSSVHKNLLTYYQEIIGDVISLHDRFPMAVISYIYLLPQRSIKESERDERIDLLRAAQLFNMITDRPHHEGHKDRYEHFAFLPVDFDTDPPSLVEDVLVDFPNLRIDDFFDKILATYRERNIFLDILSTQS